jgi:secretion/DNA translocation related TadE-like protein
VTERGAVSVVLAGVVALALMLGSGVASVGAFFHARVQAAAAADAAALAAAPVTFLPFGARGTPAEEAARFAAANGSRLVACACPVDRSWAHRTVVVDVERLVRLWPAGSITVRARGRAEFDPVLLLGG